MPPPSWDVLISSNNYVPTNTLNIVLYFLYTSKSFLKKLFMKMAALFVLYMDKPHRNCMDVIGAPPPPMAVCNFLPK